MRRVLVCCLLAGVFGVSSASAHHMVPGRVHPKVTISQSVLANGQTLPAGTYEIWITNQRPTTNAGATDNQRVVQFAQNGKVVGEDVAEVFPRGSHKGETVGTSGSSAATSAKVEKLNGGEFVRVAINEPEGRFLIHLPTGHLNEPAPQAETPSRIEFLRTEPSQSQPAPSPQPQQ